MLTTVPHATKGGEVLLIENQTKVAVMTRAAICGDGEENKAAEVWEAECRAKGSYQATWIVLIVIALAFIIMWLPKCGRGNG